MVLVTLAVAAVLLILVVWLLDAFVFFAAGRAVSTETALGDALIVAFLGAIINGGLQWAFQWILVPMIPPVPLAPYLGIAAVIGAVLITLIVYVPLIMKFFEMTFARSLLVDVLASIFNVFISSIILVIAI